MSAKEQLPTNVATEGDDQPIFPPNLFQTSTWTLQDLKHLQEVGKGKDTIIYSAQCPRLGGKTAAVKVYDRQKVAATKLRAIKREIAMMMFFNRQGVPNVVEYYAAFQDDNYYYIVMEYCSGGDLLENLLHDKKAMSERRAAADVVRPLLATLTRLHALNIIHRDIKLENIFLDGSGRVRLGDFGLTMSMRQEAAISPVGTVEYMAPEVVALPAVELVTSGQVRASTITPTSEKVDIWALGVTLYELVTGRLPFEGRDKAEIKAAITAYRLSAFPSFVSPHCQSIVRSMLAYDPAERPSAEDLLQHPYIQLYCSSGATAGRGGVVAVEVRAGPPASLTSPGGNNNSMTIPAYKSATPGAPLIGLPAPLSASSREVSAQLLARDSSSMWGGTDPATRKGSSGSLAAVLRRLSGGHKVHQQQDQNRSRDMDIDISSKSSGSWSSAGTGGVGGGEQGDTPSNTSKPGVKGAMRRLFVGRKSAPHQLGGGPEPMVSPFANILAPVDPVQHR